MWAVIKCLAMFYSKKILFQIEKMIYSPLTPYGKEIYCTF